MQKKTLPPKSKKSKTCQPYFNILKNIKISKSFLRGISPVSPSKTICSCAHPLCLFFFFQISFLLFVHPFSLVFLPLLHVPVLFLLFSFSLVFLPLLHVQIHVPVQVLFLFFSFSLVFLLWNHLQPFWTMFPLKQMELPKIYIPFQFHLPIPF